jgi:hypothetical protein
MVADDPVKEYLCKLFRSVAVSKQYYLSVLGKLIYYNKD